VTGVQWQRERLAIYAKYVHGFTDMRDLVFYSASGGFVIGAIPVGTLQTLEAGMSYMFHTITSSAKEGSRRDAGTSKSSFGKKRY
jgi:hypothetical protein